MQKFEKFVKNVELCFLFLFFFLRSARRRLCYWEIIPNHVCRFVWSLDFSPLLFSLRFYVLCFSLWMPYLPGIICDRNFRMLKNWKKATFLHTGVLIDCCVDLNHFLCHQCEYFIDNRFLGAYEVRSQHLDWHCSEPMVCALTATSDGALDLV